MPGAQIRIVQIFLVVLLLWCDPAMAQQAIRSAAPHPDDPCTLRMRQITAALVLYQSQHKSLPRHLSELYPKWIRDKEIFRCPADPVGRPFHDRFPPEWRISDPGMETSYFYVFADTPSPAVAVFLHPAQLPPNATIRRRMELNQTHFGDLVPLLQCHHHPGYMLEMRSDASVRRGTRPFELDAESFSRMIQRFASDLSKGDSVLQNWSLPATESYAARFLQSPLGANDLDHCARVADQLTDLSSRLNGQDRAAAGRLSARLLLATGQWTKAHTAAKTIDVGGGDAEAALLLAAAQYRIDGGEPPVEAYLRAEMVRRHLPGVQLAVIRNDKPVMKQTLGLANLEPATPVTEHSVFRIASVTKAFVASAVMMLMNEGKLSLDDPVSKFIPQVPPTWGEIKVHHLLSHTGGMADLWQTAEFSTRRDYSSEDLVRMVTTPALKFRPGERHDYNDGAFLLAMVIEKITGLHYGQFLKQRIFEPLGMSRTQIDDIRAVIPGRADGYIWDVRRNAHRKAEPMSATVSSLADGGMITCLADLVAWETALRGERVLKRSTLERMWTPTKLSDGSTADYGLGWELGRLRGHRHVGHHGASHFSAQILRFPETGLTVIAMCNGSGNDANELASTISAYYLPPATMTDDNPELTSRLKASIVPSAGAGSIGFLERFRSPKSFTLVDVERPSGGQVRRYLVESDGGRWLVEFAQAAGSDVPVIRMQIL